MEIGCKENKRAQSALLFSIVSNVKEDITVAICFRTNQNPRSELRGGGRPPAHLGVLKKQNARPQKKKNKI
ncbi:MAG: hypothetical protein ACK59J_21340, partial [Pseudanabaena sp.]